MVLSIRADLHQDQPFTPRTILHLGVSPQTDENHLKYAYGLMLRKIIKRLPDAKIFACIPHNFTFLYLRCKDWLDP